MPETNRRWTLAARPHGMVKESDFALRRGAGARAVGDGEVLVRDLYLSFDPTHARLDGGSPELHAAGADRRGDARGRRRRRSSSRARRASRRATSCRALFGWQDYAVAAPGALLPRRSCRRACRSTWPLGVLGITGLTAYFGLLDLGKPKAGETVVVSGAAGATGSVAGADREAPGLPRRSASPAAPRSARWLTDEARLRRRDRLQARGRRRRASRELCPKGIDVYFDNVGGEILDAALAQPRACARASCSAARISGYNETDAAARPAQPDEPGDAARAHGGLHRASTTLPRFGEARRASSPSGCAEGKIVHQEDVQHGLENAPKTFLRLFRGENTGKQLLQIAEPDFVMQAPASPGPLLLVGLRRVAQPRLPLAALGAQRRQRRDRPAAALSP